MLEPPSRNIAAIPLARMRDRALSIRARRPSSVIGGTGGASGLSDAIGSTACPTASRGPNAATPASAADCVRKSRRFIVSISRKVIERGETRLLHREVLRIDVGESPGLKLASPFAEVFLGHAHEVHLHVCRHVLV